jgi:hypothetical protein
MGCRTQFCIGGGCVPTSTDVQAWCEAFGYAYNASDPLYQDYKNLLADLPAPYSQSPAFLALAEASMRCRAPLFCNSNPGDARTTQSATLSANALGVSVTSGISGEESAIGGAANVGEQIASSFGASIPGVGSALDLLFSAFQEHAQAEAKQAKALSNLCPYFAEATLKADSSVVTGVSTPDEALSFLQSCAAEFASADASLTKSCNAFCWYNKIVELIAQVSQYYYQYLAPVGTSGEANNFEENVPTAIVITKGAQSSPEQPLNSAASAIAPWVTKSLDALQPVSTSTKTGLVIVALAIVAIIYIAPRLGGER